MAFSPSKVNVNRQLPLTFTAAMVFEIAVQRVQSPPRCIHVVCGLRPVQLKELKRQLGGMGWLNSRFASGGEELFDAGMPEALDHAYSVSRHFSAFKQNTWASLFPFPLFRATVRMTARRSGTIAPGALKPRAGNH